MNTLFWRALWAKNIVLLILLPLTYYGFTRDLQAITTSSTLETLLLFVGLLLVVPLFVNFTLSYSHLPHPTTRAIIMGQIVTFTAMYTALALLVMIDLLFLQLVGDILLFRIIISMMILSIFAYDIWDGYRYQS